MNYFKKILRFAKPYKKYAVLNIISNIFYALFSTLSFVVFIPMLNVLFEQTPPVEKEPVYTGLSNLKIFLEDSLNFFLNNQVKLHGDTAALSYICGAMVVLFFLKNIANYAALFFITFLRNGVIKDIRNAMYDKLVNLPISYFTEKRKGDVIAKMTSDVQEVEWSFLMVLELIVRDPLTIIFTLAFMIAISAKLTLFMFIFLPLVGLLIAFIGKKLRADSDVVQKENGFFLSLIEESLTGLRVIKGFTAEKQFTSKFQGSTNKLFKTMNSLMNKKNLASPTSEFMGITVIVAILWYGGSIVLSQDKTIETMSSGAFIGFMALAYNILTPAKSISNAIYGIKKGDASAKRVIEVLETENPITDKKDAVIKTVFDSEIVFDNISFKYQDEYVLKNFSLTIPKGKTVALVGQSGSGKSTLANLITRFYDVNEGAIYIDGVNIKEISKDSLRKLMGIVTQDSILFNDTIANNISLGLENPQESKIIEAAKIANAHEFIKDLPQQYNSKIGDSGNMLSGGQKQRLSIARAVLKNPPIMVLDEATSALDTESEQLVQQALEKMMQNRTSLVIAHRLSTIQKADTIVVLRKGVIIEQGKHQELLDKQGDYFKLVSMQNLD